MSALTRQTVPRLVTYIATREPTYSRVAILKAALEANFDVDSITSSARSYPIRLLQVIGLWIVSRLSRRRTPEIVVVGFLPQPILPIVRLLWKGPLVSDGYLSLFNTLVEDKAKVSPNSLPGHLARVLDQFMLNKSDVVLADTNSHIDYYKSKSDGEGPRFVRVWVGCQAGTFRPLPELHFDGTEPFHVLFWGGYIPLQGVDIIVRAASMLDSRKYRITLIGRGQTYRECRRIASNSDAGNIQFLDPVPLKELSAQAKSAHLLLGIFGASDKAQRVIPNKVYEALALAKPLITMDSPAVRELLSSEEVMLVPHADPGALADRIRRAASDYSTAKLIARRGHAKFQITASTRHIEDSVWNGVNSSIERRPSDAK